MSVETEALHEQLLEICFPEDEHAEGPDLEDAITALVEALAVMLVVPVWKKDVPMSVVIEDIAQRLRAAADAKMWECVWLEEAEAMSNDPPDTNTAR
jgi:hypothetical protein